MFHKNCPCLSTSCHGLLLILKERYAKRIASTKKLSTLKISNIGKLLSINEIEWQNWSKNLTSYWWENPKKFWSYVKYRKSESLGISPLKPEDGVSITDKDKAETLNSHFFSVFTHEQKPLPQIGLSPFTSIVDLLFSPDGVA